MQLERLKSILVETDNLADVIALETEIARVTMEIEALTGELRRYDALIEYTTIDITVYETVYREGPAAAKTVGERIEARLFGFAQRRGRVLCGCVRLVRIGASGAPGAGSHRCCGAAVRPCST